MYDLIIIGSGPAGLSAAVYAKRAGLKLLVLEGSAVSGGQVLTTYEVDNYLGMPGMSGQDMGKAFREHAERLGVEFHTSRVTQIQDLGDKKLVQTRKESLETRAVILAAGAGHARLGVPGEDVLAGMGVSYCATCDGAFYRDKTVAVVGGGDVALEDAVYLSELCRKVYLIHRRDEFRGAKILQDKIHEISNIEILYSHTVQEILGVDGVEGLRLRDIKKEEDRRLAVDGVFIAVGIVPDTKLVKELVSCDEAGYVLAGEDCVTDRPGIFAAGDVRKKPLRQIVTAAADGANAAVSAGKFCRNF